MILYLFLTALTVSIDSFICGFSLSFIKGQKKLIVLIITATVYVMCLFTNYLIFFTKLQNQYISAIIGGVILVLVGIYNLVKKDEEINTGKSDDQNLIKQSFITGIAVGIDGAGANLSLALMGINYFYVPLLIALMHGLLITFGIFLGKTVIGKLIRRYDFIPPLILILLGLYKIITILI